MTKPAAGLSKALAERNDVLPNPWALARWQRRNSAPRILGNFVKLARELH